MFNGCTSTSIGETSQQVTTGASVHQQNKYSVGQEFADFFVTVHKFERAIIDASQWVEKLMTVEAIYIK